MLELVLTGIAAIAIVYSIGVIVTMAVFKFMEDEDRNEKR